MRWLDDVTDPMDMSLSKLWEMVKDRDVLQSTGLQRIRQDSVTEQRWSEWTAIVVPREKPHTGAAAREQPRDSPVIER